MAKIIITDDAMFIRELLGDIITEAGHTIVSAKSGEELLEKYEVEKPDIVFLDIVMEDNGLDTLDCLMAKHPDAKVVICSAIGSMEAVVDLALQKGAITCLKKPFGVDDVLGAIDMCIK